MVETPATRASLLLRLRDAQDAEAWSRFVDLYAPLVHSYARKQGLQDADAADLTQEVLRAVAGAAGRFEYDPARGSFRSWLYTVVRNKLHNFRAPARRIPRGTGDTSAQELLEQQPAPEEDGTLWEEEHRRHLLAWAAARVKEQVQASTWEAFWRTAVEGKSGKEVAGELGLSVAAVYLARGRVMARLREEVRLAQEG